MCGILGLVGEAHPQFTQALRRLVHRGPDAEGVWEAPGIQLGHRRLSIFDLTEAGNQPMHFGDYVVVFNGEIYNFLELRHRLTMLGCTFQTDTDTEVLLQAYLHWGADCLHQFNGMWAFAIWDKARRELFFARDRFGVKPFYYAEDSGRFIFGSEQKAVAPLLAHLAISERFEWLAKYRIFYESTQNTLIQGVQRLPAGYWGKWAAGKLSLQRYWNTLEHIDTDIPGSYEEQCAGWRTRFFTSCKLRSRSDVPVATALSGGLDSSSIFCAQHYQRTQGDLHDFRHQQELRAFSAVFPGTTQDETEYAQAVLDYTGREGLMMEMHEEIDRDFSAMMDGYYYMEDLWPSNPVPMIELYRAIRREGFRVSLDGHGGDELMGGYHTGYRALGMAYPHVGDMLDIVSAYPEQDNLSVLGKLGWALRYLHTHRKELSRSRLLNIVGRLELPEAALHMLRLPSQSITPEYTMDTLVAANYSLYHQTILPALLRNYDRFSMAASIESRAPFMDYKLATYSFGLGWQSLVRNGYSRAIVRDSLADIMPEKVARRRSKVGFNAPGENFMVPRWYNGFIDLLSSERETLPGCKDPDTLIACYQQALRGPLHAKKTSGLHTLWQEALPYVWHSAFFKRLAL